MSGRLSSPIGSMAIVAAVLVSGVVGLRANTARADDCLTQPNSPTPEGSHWYFRTDRANQRKCWYLRAPDQPAQRGAAQARSDAAPATHTIPLENSATASAGAPMSISPDDSAPPLPHIKMLAVKPQRAPSGTTDEAVQQSVQSSSIPAAPPPQASTASQPSAQGAKPAPAAATVWPDPPAPATVKAQEPIAAQIDARTDSGQPKVDAKASNGAESTARAGASTTNAAGMAASLTTTPAEMLPILALGLAVAGVLFRVVIKIAAARRRRIIVDRPESDWIDDRGQNEWRDDQPQQSSVDERDEFIDDLHPALIPSASDYSTRRAFEAVEKWPDNARGKDGVFQITDEISEREDTLEQLRRDLDRLLQSPKVA